MGVVNQPVAQGRFRAIKVRLGVIKTLEWFFAIVAFSTCVSYSGMFRVSVECKDRTDSDLSIEVEFEYPFRLHRVYFDAPTCQGGHTERYFLAGDSSSSAELFVTVGVLALLSASAALGVYIFFFDKYKENNKGPVIDLGATAFVAFMWLVSSAAWAKGVSDVKTATDPERWVTLIKACASEANRCRGVHDPDTSGLNASVALGFMNLTLWAGNLWLVFKETGVTAPPPQTKPTEGAYEQDLIAAGQGGYKPDYNQDAEYSQGCGQQGAPTSFSNQM